MEQAIKFSRENYARPIAEVKQILSSWEEGDYNPDSTIKSNSPFDEEVEFEEPII